MTESPAVTSFADRDMYARFIGFGVGHDAQYDRSIINFENQDTEDNILDENQIPGNYEENDSGANYCNGETACDTNIGMEGGEDTFDDDDDEDLENSNTEDEFSDVEENENEGEEVPEFKF